ncbi:MAG: hypothetical protein DRP66_09915 [Planctomycetota bacterium]|nr:MAG: hypothetical protein DRP66_09915 [Planctomycetota bacterium]
MRLFVLALYIFAVAAVGLCAETTETEYYAIRLDGKKIGHVVQTRRIKDGVVTTAEDMTMTLARSGAAITVAMLEKSIETSKGKPIAFEVVQNISGVSQKTTGKIIGGEQAKIVTEAMGVKQERTVSFPDGALMSEGMRLLERQKGLKEGASYEATVFSPALLMAVKVAVSVGPRKEIDLFGRIARLTEVTTTMKIPTGSTTSTDYVDDNHRALKTLLPTMGMTLEIIACDKQFALSSGDVVDFLDKMLLASPVPLKDVKSLTSATYTLVPAKDAKPKIPSGDSQTAKTLPNGRITVEVKPAKAAPKVKFPYKGNKQELLEALEPTQYLQSDNEQVVKLARDAVGDSTDAAEAARKIESFVAGYITEKNLSVGYATAAEVALSRQGDCTEHAVLTAAMCRAVGIPARVVFGLVYVDEFGDRKHVFGGHAWTEARIGAEWIGLDATRAPNGYGVGHIILATGSGEPADFFGMINTLGYFKIARIDLK